MDGRARHSPHADPPRNGTGLGLARAQVGIHPHSHPPPIAMKIVLSSSSSLHLFFIVGEEQEEEEEEEEAEAEVGFKTVRKEERRKNAAALASGSRSVGRSLAAQVRILRTSDITRSGWIRTSTCTLRYMYDVSTHSQK